MKLILGDNQFFGINHTDLKKARETKQKFNSKTKITEFIENAMNLGMDGFMMNSNDIGYDVVQDYNFNIMNEECHYSIPYPHKYAAVVNDTGMFSLLFMVLKRVKFTDAWHIVKFLFSFEVTHLIPVLLRMEIPKNLPKGSVVYLQNIVTDMVMGLSNGKTILEIYIDSINKMGYRPGFITLNIDTLYKLLSPRNMEEIHICFNFNSSGFNVFPSIKVVESTMKIIKNTTNWKLMAMSVFSSGASGKSIEESISFIKDHELDYVVFGTSRVKNITSNIALFHGKDS